MFRYLKKYFIPHENNDHKPHILRWEAVLAILSFALIIEIYFLAQIFILAPFTDIFSSVLPSALITLTNENRQQTGYLQNLTVSPALTKAARLKANDMAEKNYFAHTSPEGKTPWHWLTLAEYQYTIAGENLAVNFTDSLDIANAWMNSAAHRANILNNNFTEIGIGIAKGNYGGRETIFVAQFFGRPAAERPAAEVARPSGSQSPKSDFKDAPKSDFGNSVSTKNNAAQRRTISATERQESFTLVQPVENPNKTSTSAEIVRQDGSIAGEADKAELKASDALNLEHLTPSPSRAAAGAAAKIETNPTSKIQRALTNPRAITNYLFIMLITIIALALALKIFIKIKIQHPRLIINGLFALLIISSLMWTNQILALSQAIIF